MRAISTTPQGGVEIIEVADPQPTPHQVVIAATAASIARGDLNTSRLRPPPSLLGLDVAGVVVRAAADGSGPAEGTRVLGYSAGNAPTWAQRVALDTDLVAPVPDGLSDETAAALPNSGLAAFDGVAAGGFLLGARVLITGATGGVGILAAQLALLAGAASVTGQVSSPARASALPRLDGLTAATLDELQGPFDLIVDLIGGDVLTRALSLVAEGGTVASLSQTADETATVPRFWFATHPGARLIGVDNRVALRVPGVGTRHLTLLAQLAASGQLDPMVSTVAPWDQAGDLMAKMDRRELSGRAVIRIA